jgi:hypothetical protein
MRTFLALFIVGIVASAIGQVQPVVVPPEVKGLLAPTLETWRKLNSDPKCVALGDPGKDSPSGALFTVSTAARFANLSSLAHKRYDSR